MTDRSPEERPSPFRRPGWIASAALIVVVLVVGAAVIFWPRGDSPQDDPTSPGTAETTDTATTEPPDPDASICGLEPGDQAIPTQAPEGATWTLHGTFAAPSIEGVGPGITADDGLTHCFAQSPTGALLAAINYAAMGQVDPLSSVDPRLVADTPEREALADEYASEPPTPTEGGTVQVVGFTLEEQSTGDIAVTLGIRVSDTGTMFSLTYTMRWESGDWKLVMPPGGDITPTPIEGSVDSAGLIPWAGA